jgi:hypothetical protein
LWSALSFCRIFTLPKRQKSDAEYLHENVIAEM